MQFVRFGLHCIQETPLSGGLTPGSRVADTKQLSDAVLRVEAWLAGEDFGHLHDDVRAAATKEGPYKTLMTGHTAACWSICHLYEAVRAVIRAGKDVSDLNDVGMNVARSAAFARSSSDEGVTLPAIEFQEQLVEKMFGAAVIPLSAVKSGPSYGRFFRPTRTEGR